MGWIPSIHRQWKVVISYWCRIVNCEDTRVNKKICLWCEQINQLKKNVKNWNFNVKQIFMQYGFPTFANVNELLYKKRVLSSVLPVMFNKYKIDWQNNIRKENGNSCKGGNKLRTYKLFKHNYCTEFYCTTVLPLNHRSAFAKFRCGVAPLRIETGRYENILRNERFCFNCKDCIENEEHVILICPLYNDLREVLFNNAVLICPSFKDFNLSDKMAFLFSNILIMKSCAKTCLKILEKRRDIVYRGV